MKKVARQTASLWLSFALCCLPLAPATGQVDAALRKVTQEAKQAYVNHDYDGAAARYEEALKLASGVSPKALILLYSNLGAAYREAHKLEQAQTAFKKAIGQAEKNNLERDPIATNAMRQYAVLLRRMGKNVDAELMESRALGTALVMPPPENLPAATTQPSSLPEPDRRDTAGDTITDAVPVRRPGAISLEDLKQAVAEHPDDYSVWGALAAKYIALSDWSQAISTLLTIERKFPRHDKRIHSQLAYCYSKNGDYANAISETQSAIAANPGDSGLYLNLHTLYIATGDLKSAMAVDQNFLDKFPNDASFDTVKNMLQTLQNQMPAGDGSQLNAAEMEYNWPAYYFPLKVYVSQSDEDFHFAPSTTGMIQQTPSEVVASACEDWWRASQQHVSFTFVQRPEDATIEIAFTKNPNGLEAGRAGVCQWSTYEEHQKVRITILLVDGITGKPLTPETVLCATLHELGHGLGLAHSSLPQDIMFPSLQSQPLTELSANDARRVIRLYTH